MSLNEKKAGLSITTIPSTKFIRDLIKSQSVVEILNHALADEAILSMKTRNAKWNLVGPEFFELCLIYELHLKQINDFSDMITNRLQILQGQQVQSFSEYIANSRLIENPGVTPDVFQLLTDHESVIRFFREDYRKCINSYEDSGTSEMLLSIIRQHEKIAWMLRSFIQQKPINSVFPAIN